MAAIDITSAGSTPLNDGILQLETGVPMDSTLRNVADQNDTTSPLKLSTTAVQVVSPLRITTDDPSDFYLDCEDGSSNNRFSITRNTASQQVNLNFSSNPAGSTTQVGAIRTYQDGVNLSDVVTFREDGQVTFSERVNVEADSLVTTQSSSVIAASTTNANLVIAPNGTGALVASIPDGTATGGNARGVNAVDLQTSRTLNTQVAGRDYSVITGGQNNLVGGVASAKWSGILAGRGNSVLGNFDGIIAGDANTTNASGSYNVIGGGLSNAVSGSAAYSGVFSGSNNIASTNYSVVLGGLSNTASSSFSVVSGGQSNTASTNTHATVVGGQSNTSSASKAISGGFSNTASGSYSVALGFVNTASGVGSNAIGIINNASADYGTAIGARSNAYLLGQFANAGSNFTEVGFGDCQNSLLNAFRVATLTTGATATLSLDGTGTTNLIIPKGSQRSWNVQVRWVAVVTAITGTATGVNVGDTKTSTDLLAVAKRGVGVTTVSAHTSAGTHAIETIAGSLTAANITYTAGASQEMAITFTGPTFAGGGSVTMRVVAAISLTEVAY